MKNIKSLVAATLAFICIFACASCDNSNIDAQSTTQTAYITLDPEKTISDSDTSGPVIEPLSFDFIPNLSSTVFDVYTMDEESNEPKDIIETIIFMSPINGVVYIKTEDSYNRSAFNYEITPVDMIDSGSEDADIQLSDTEYPYYNYNAANYAEYQLTSAKIKFSGDMEIQYDMFVLDNNLYLSSTQDDIVTTYLLKQRLQDTGTVEQSINEEIRESIMTPTKVLDSFKEANAPKELIDFLTKLSNYPCTLTEKIHNGTLEYTYTQKIMDSATAIIVLTASDNTVMSEALYSSSMIYDIDRTKKQATALYPTNSYINIVDELQLIINQKADKLRVSSDIAVFNDVEYTHINVTDNNSFNKDFYFDKSSGDIKYIVSGTNVAEVLEFNNDTLNADEFKLPDDITTKLFE